MKGGNRRVTKGKSQQNPKIDDKSPIESGETDDGASKQANHEGMEAIQANIIAEIKAVRSDLKKEFSETMEPLRKELVDFREDVNQKLSAIVTDLKEITDRVTETEQRVADMEELGAENSELLSHTLKLQEKLQARLTDLESRSRRNNIRIHGIPEGAEGDNVQEFLETFIKTELSLPDVTLAIQRCHRSLGAKPPQGANPRSMVIYFLEYKTKELVLHAAWKKNNIQCDGKRVFFEQDYPTEIVMKRKAYSNIRKALKEQGLRFQTLHPAKLRVFLDTGPVIYNSAPEAMDDLKKKGLMPNDGAGPVEDRATPATGRRQPSWETAGGTSRRHREARMKHIQEKLKGFRRNKGAMSN